jgi:hypothetical protein
MGRLREAQSLVVSQSNPRFLICGSGRSGTSAVAQILHAGGVEVGHNLVPGDEHNAEGYFEERTIIEINQAILHAAGIGPPFTWASRAQMIEAAHQYADYMLDAASHATPAWKDPRFCWTLEPWLAFLERRPAVIVCLRSPAEVAASTMAYFGQVGDEPRATAYHVWKSQYERLLEVVDSYGLHATVVEYSQLQTAPNQTVNRLAEFVGLPLSASTVRADLRHHEAAVPDDLVDLYRRVQHL